MTRTEVRCLLCGAQMQRERDVALVTYNHADGSVFWKMVRFACATPDCGNEVVVEEDLPF